MGRILHFSSPAPNISFSIDKETGKLIKQGLVLAEGSWKDGRLKKVHTFDEERLLEIAENTNAFFNQGNRIPILKDHKNSSDTTIGDLESTLEVREITEDDLEDPRFNHLLGKFGLFANQISIKALDSIRQAEEGILNTISPGLDIVENLIKEISVTPTPAIPGMRLFYREEDDSMVADFAVTWEALEEEREDFKQVKDELDGIYSKFCKLIENIMSAGEEELAGFDRKDLAIQAIEQYMARIAASMGITQESIQESDYGMNSTLAPSQSKAQKQVNEIMSTKHGKGYPYVGFSKEKPKYVAAFSMADMAEFNKYSDAINFLRKRWETLAEGAKKKGKQFAEASKNKAKTDIENTTKEAVESVIAGARKGAVRGLVKDYAPALAVAGVGTAGALGGASALGSYVGTRAGLSKDRKMQARKRLQQKQERIKKLKSLSPFSKSSKDNAEFSLPFFGLRKALRNKAIDLDLIKGNKLFGQTKTTGKDLYLKGKRIIKNPKLGQKNVLVNQLTTDKPAFQLGDRGKNILNSAKKYGALAGAVGVGTYAGNKLSEPKRKKGFLENIFGG